MSKLTLKDIEIIGEGPQIRKAIEQQFGSLEEFYKIHSTVTKKYNTLLNYLSRDVIISDSFKCKITIILDVDYPSLYFTKQKQIKSHVQNIYDNIREYEDEDDQQLFDNLLELCKEENMTDEIAMMYRAKARNSYSTNRLNYCMEFYEHAIEILPKEKINMKTFFICELAYDFTSENMVKSADKKYNHVEYLVSLHKNKLDDNTLFHYHYWRGVDYTNNDKIDKAREFFKLAQVYSTTNSQKASSLANIGLIHRKHNKYNLALKNYQDALSYPDESRILTTASIYNNIAEVYKCKRNYPKALTFVQKALEISEKENDLGKHLIYISTKVEIQMAMGDKEAYKNFFSLLLSTKGKKIFSKPYILNAIKIFVKYIGDTPCLDELSDIIIELRNASTSDGYDRGLVECVGHATIKIRELTKGVKQ